MVVFQTLLQKYDYRRKLQLLNWAIIPIFLLCYFFAFKKTADMIKEYKSNQQLSVLNATYKDSIRIYENKQNMIATWKKQYVIESGMVDGNILADINIICDNLGINFVEYKPLGTNNENIWTRSFTVEGDYSQMLKLIYTIEQQKKICRIASVSFKKVKVSDNDVLRCSLYIQNIVQP